MPQRTLLVALVVTSLGLAGPIDSAKEKAMKADLAGQVESMRDQVQIMIDTIFSFAELGFQEFETSKYLTGILEAEGFKVLHGIAGIPSSWMDTHGSGKHEH